MLDQMQLGHQRPKAGAGELGNSTVLALTNGPKQRFDAIPTDPGHDPELREMRPDGVDQRGSLTDKHLVGAVQDEHTLLLGRFDLDEAHRWARHGFADGLRVGGIVLLVLHVGLHVARRHQAYAVPELLDLPCPVVRRSAGLHPDQTRRQLLEEWQHLTPAQLAANDDHTFRINTMNLEH
jgi:hypothetical protein